MTRQTLNEHYNMKYKAIDEFKKSVIRSEYYGRTYEYFEKPYSDSIMCEFLAATQVRRILKDILKGELNIDIIKIESDCVKKVTSEIQSQNLDEMGIGTLSRIVSDLQEEIIQ